MQNMLLRESHHTYGPYIVPVDPDDVPLFLHCAPGVRVSTSDGIECDRKFYASTARPLLLAHGIAPIIKQ